MDGYFGAEYDGPAFELFGAGHLAVISLIVAIVVFLVRGCDNPGERTKQQARRLLAGLLLVFELSWHAWSLANGSWNLQQHLPLHACSLSVWASIFVLLTRNYRVYEIFFFIGIAGAGQTVLTPDAGIYGLPHFRAIQTLGAHGLIVIAMVYMTAIEGFRPTRASIWKALLAANVYMLFVTAINFWLGSNYMYTLRKPATASLPDLMGAWPWYLVGAEFLALAMFALLYLPFALSNAVRGSPVPERPAGSR